MSAEFVQAERQIAPILAAGRRYDYGQTPAAFYALQEAERTTTNCKDVGHQAVRQLLAIELPPDMQIVEAYADPESRRPLFSRVHQTDELHLGDWILFGRQDRRHPRAFRPQYDPQEGLMNWRDFAINHLGVYLGDHRGEHMVLHAAPGVGAEITNLRSIQRSRRTAVIHEVLRLRAVD